MSKTTPKKFGEQHALWLFRNLVDSNQGDHLLEAACERGRVERWGHAARIPVWADGDDVVLVVGGNVVAERGTSDESVRLTRGDAFGKTAKGRISTASAGDVHMVTSIRETTICSIPRQELREIWESNPVPRQVEAGRWFNKEQVEVPVWPLLGAMPTTRLARILLHLVENYGDIDGRRGRLPLTLRTAQLATLAGVSKGRASRVWNLFEQTGLVQSSGGALILEDLVKLREYALG